MASWRESRLRLTNLPRGFEPEISRRISEGVKTAGFVFVTVDLEGYRQGSLEFPS